MDTTENNSDTETESTEEEVEPKLKYVRITNDLQNILNKDAVTCVAVHPRFLFFGTFFGNVYLLDHQGNFVDSFLNRQQSFSHSVSVNQISIDSKGEYVATCSDDGRVIINELYNEESHQKLEIGKFVRSVALDPDYHKSGSGRRLIVGDDRLTLFERNFVKGLRSTVLSESEGLVSAVAWSGQFVAWASSLGVRVYDLNEKCSLGLIKWDEQNGIKLESFRCNLRWANSTTLLIGWVDTIRICIIRKRNAIEVSTRDLPGYIVDPISTFQTDFFVCGVAPLDANQLVVLGHPKERDAESKKALRPILCVLQYKTSDYSEICTDSLSLRGYQEYKVNDYHLDCLIEENRYFIVSPKDVVVASLYENDDRVQWLIDHRKFDQAIEVISAHGGKYSLVNVARLYIDHLIAQKQFDEAAKLCLRAFGSNKVLWEEEVYKFVKVQQLRSVSAYLPRTNDCKLKPQVYEMVLYEYLKLDSKGFLNLVKEWHPSLYNTSAVINAIHDNFSKRDADELLESLAILYSHEKKYDNALTMYLKLQNKDVFDLIKKHNLYNVIHQMIIPLIQLDEDRAIQMLLEKNKIPPEIVVQQLEQRQDYMYLYLDALDKVDNTGKFHYKLVNLYAKYDRDKLLSFLKRSDRYPIQEAFDTCKRELFYPEMVYLLGRMGCIRDALNIIMHNIKDINMAIEFCQEHDDADLWDALINESLEKPEIMTKLLDGIVGYVNPEILVNKIKLGQQIPGLKKSLIKMLCDYGLRVSIQDGFNEILVTDYFNLQEKLVHCHRRGLYVASDNVCGLCRRDIIVKDPLKTDIIVFNCRHCFHENCLPDRYNVNFCTVCNSKQ
ncbi:unnamed protein product [Hermetia illucens]|uniref:Vacuolar protein sorting-associated protein 41 homolog n=1 Tax=Hermetia illucens TaxID=343691 RepID=A0A7R8UTZ2_HERIL|nr:vacuolar protein sorting-associated protein 41 homolog [Hermetia illucens]CAD7086533.1 unnamed protein product [Hermetia illucens]